VKFWIESRKLMLETRYWMKTRSSKRAKKKCARNDTTFSFQGLNPGGKGVERPLTFPLNED
jgi:hypothetical protein